MDEAKPFNIPKRVVWKAFKRVKANQGAAGVDKQSIAGFEADLSNNLYKLWNRMCSGSYFPPPVRRVEIPKADGGMRPLGIPTVADRIAQEVARRYLEPRLEPVFHTDSYGYRPGRSAIDAVRTARQRCWRADWVLDIDVKGYFDSIDWELLLKAVRRHTDCPWVLLYIERWLKAPVQMEDGSVVPRTAGTPQGGVISPLLANLFLHYAFDMWMARTYPHIPFERYADDIICHCKSAEEARALWGALADRFAACKLVLHPQKTKIVYCKDANRRGDFPSQSFDFLGFSFRARKTLWQGHIHTHGFLPAARPKALTSISRAIRRWALHHHSDKSLQDLAKTYNPYIEGWINYYGQFYRTHLRPTLKRIDVYVSVREHIESPESVVIQQWWPDSSRGSPMWTVENRRRYDRSPLRYPSDLTDAEWAYVAPLIPPARRGGNRRHVDVREVMNGIMYILSTGCQWRAIPKDLPPRSTLFDYLDLWSYDGTLARIHDALYVECRERDEREGSPTAAIIDSQSVKSAEKGGPASIRMATMRARRSRARSATFWSTRSAS